MRLRWSSTSYSFLPPDTPSPGCFSFPPLATTSLRDILFESSMLLRVYAIYGFHHPFSLNHSYRYVSSGRERARSSDTQRVQGELSSNQDCAMCYFHSLSTHVIIDCNHSNTHVESPRHPRARSPFAPSDAHAGVGTYT